MVGQKPYHIVIAEPFDAEAIRRLEKIGSVHVLKDAAPETLVKAVGEADALIVRAKAHVTARVIGAAPRLKVIGRASPNLDHIDLRAASRRKISVVYAPHVAVASMAEYALAMILAAHRRVLHFDREVREGRFEALRTPAGRQISALTIGLLGIDAVADQLGRMISAAFGSTVIYHDPAGASPSEFEGRRVDSAVLFVESDIVSVHLNVSAETRKYVNAERLAAMKASAILVNVSRGTVVDTVALSESLRKRQIAGAALDVFEVEPLPTEHLIRRAPNCILTPHIGGATLDAAAERYKVTEDVVRVLSGERPRFPVELPAV